MNSAKNSKSGLLIIQVLLSLLCVSCDKQIYSNLFGEVNNNKIYYIIPNYGTEPDTVTITDLYGTMFMQGATVKLSRSGYSDMPATAVTVVSPDRITCQFDLTGAEFGQWDVVVINPDDDTAILAGGFTVLWLAPTVLSITPDSWPRNGTATITDITGTNFKAGAVVTLTNGTDIITSTGVTVSSVTQISSCTFDLSTATLTGSWDLTVINTDSQSATLPGSFTTYVPFVAVGQSGRTIVSADGINWSNDQSGGEALNGITFGNGYFVAVGDNGRIIRSRDGITWDDYSYGTNQLRGIAYGNGYFIAVGDNYMIIRSDDNGENWTVLETGGNDLWDVCFGNNVFVAVGVSGLALWSADNGDNWTAGTGSGTDTLSGTGYGFTGSVHVFVAVGENGQVIRSSDNGISWTDVLSGTNWRRDIVYGAGAFISVEEDLFSPYSTDIIRSVDGTGWTTESTVTYSLYGINFGNGMLVCVGDNGNTVYSNDGINWTENFLGGFDLYSIAYGQ